MDVEYQAGSRGRIFPQWQNVALGGRKEVIHKRVDHRRLHPRAPGGLELLLLKAPPAINVGQIRNVQDDKVIALVE